MEPNSCSGSSSSISGSEDQISSHGYSSDWDGSSSDSCSSADSGYRYQHPNEFSILPQSTQRLPAAKRIGQIRKALMTNRVVCVVGETGSGKSTVIPYALAQGDVGAKILVTQPRRIATISLAEHVKSSFFGPTEDRMVGHRVRAERTDSEQSRIVYATAGYLRTMLTHDPDELCKFSHLVLDEMHERAIDSDFLSLLVKRLLALPEHAKTKLVIMSATLESNLFAEYFREINGDVFPPTVQLVDSEAGKRGGSLGVANTGSGGSNHAIDEFFLEELPFMESGKKYESLVSQCLSQFDNVKPPEEVAGSHGVQPGDLSEPAANLLVELALDMARNQFSTLVFLPGLGEILSVQEKLVDQIERRGESVIEEVGGEEAMASTKPYYHIFVLHSTLPHEEQRKALVVPKKLARHIVLCTNVAESSLTVPKVNVVIDSGLRRTNSYDPTNKVYRLTSVWCSRASCMQRRGRTGRVCDGTYVKLFTQNFFTNHMTPYDTPEVLLSDLTVVFMNAKYISEFWKLPADVDGSKMILRPSEILGDLVTPPRVKSITAAIVELFEAGILRKEPNEMSELSLLGTLATRLHVEPQIARIIYFGWLMGMTCEGLVLAAACSLDTEVIRGAIKYQPGQEASFTHSIYNFMWYRVGYDRGSFSEPIALRNLLWAWVHDRYKGSISAEVRDGSDGTDGSASPPEYFAQAVYGREFTSFLHGVENLCKQFISWVHDEIGDLNGENDAARLYSLLSEESAISGDIATTLGQVFVAQHDYDKLKMLILISMNMRLLNASGLGGLENSSGGIDGLDDPLLQDDAFEIVRDMEQGTSDMDKSKDESVDQDKSELTVPTAALDLIFEKVPEQCFSGCKDRSLRMSQIAQLVTGRPPVKVTEVVSPSTLEQLMGGGTSTWVVVPGRDGSHRDDSNLVLNDSAEFAGLIAPISVRTCLQVFERRFACTIDVRQFVKADRDEDDGKDGKEDKERFGSSSVTTAKLKVPRYLQAVDWAQTSFVEAPVRKPQRLPVNVNAKAPVGWLHKVAFADLNNRGIGDTYWAVAGKIIGTTRTVSEETLPSESRAYNVTVLPIAKGGRVAIAMLLAALPFQQGLVCQAALGPDGEYEILRVKINGNYVDCNMSQKFPVTKRILRAVAQVRKLVRICTDMPGTCIRGSGLSKDKNIEDAELGKLKAIQNVSGKSSLVKSVEMLLDLAHGDPRSSKDIFSSAPAIINASLIPRRGYNRDLITDPNRWKGPPTGIETLLDTVANDNSAEVIVDDWGFPRTKREQDQLPLERLTMLGFSAEEISRYLQRKPKFNVVRAPVNEKIFETVFDETAAIDLTEKDLNPGTMEHPPPDWILTPWSDGVRNLFSNKARDNLTNLFLTETMEEARASEFIDQTVPASAQILQNIWNLL